MAVMVWDAQAQAWRDAENPKIWDSSNNAWKESTGLVWDSSAGAWKEAWSPVKPERLYIIKNGIQDSSITGGWKWLRVVGSPFNYWKSGYLELSNQHSNGSTNYYITNNAIPLTGKSELYITMSSALESGQTDGGQHIGLYTNNWFPANNLNGALYAVKYVSKTLSKQTICIPFSASQGKFLGIGVEAISGTTRVKVYDIWLE